MSIITLGSIYSNLAINPHFTPPAPPPASNPIIVPDESDDTGIAPADTAAPVLQAGQQQQAALQNSQALLATGRQAMSQAMQTLAIDWETVKTRIASLRPDLLDKQWDFESDKGTIIAVSNSLSTADVNWLTGILNQNSGLVADTQTLNKIMVSTFGGTAAMAANDPLGMTLSSLNEDNIDGKVDYLSLLAGADYESYQAFSANLPNNLALAMFGSSGLNLPAAGQIDAISALAPETITTDHRQTQLQANTGMQKTAYADALNVAFQRFLSPQFSATSAADGTAVAPDSSVQADLIATLIGAVNNPMGDMTSVSNSAVALTTNLTDANSTAIDQSLQSTLGAAYRTYGEADTPAPRTTGPADTATGAGSVKDVYDEKDPQLTPAEQSILGPMQALGADWETSKEAIASVRADLLSDDWDFVSDNETVQTVSTSLTTEQRLWLTAKLNQNANLVADTQAINTSLSVFYQTQYANDTDPADVASTYGAPGANLAGLTPQDMDGRLDYLALMGGEDPTEQLVQSIKDGMPLPD